MNRRRFIYNAVLGLMVPFVAGPVVQAATIRVRGRASRFGQTIASGISAPTEISGCFRWFDFSDTSKLWQNSAGTTAVASDGDPVRLIQDKSGNAGTGTAPSDAARPLYKTGLLNGLGGLLFDGAGDYFALSGGTWTMTSASAFIVVKADADPAAAGNGGLWRMSSASVTTRYPDTAGDVYEAFGSTALKTVGNPATTLAQWNLYHVVTAASNYNVRLNTASIFSTGTNTVGWPPGTQELGGRSTATTWLKGWVAEMIIYDSVLSAGDQAKVEQFLKTKWGLSTY